MQSFNKIFLCRFSSPALFSSSMFSTSLSLSLSLSPFPYVAHFSFNPFMAPFLSLAIAPPFLSFTSHLSYTTSLTSPPSTRHHPPAPTRFSSVLSTRAPSPNPITLPLESSPHLSTSPSPLLFQQQPPPHSPPRLPARPPPPRLWLLLPLRRALVSGRLVQDAPSVRGQWSGCFLCSPPQRFSNHDWRSQSLSFTLE